MFRPLRATFARLVGAALMVTSAGLLVSTAGAQESSSATATITKQGWWNLRGSPTTAVPADGLPVSAIAGETDKVSALGITISFPPGARVDSLAIRLQAHAAPGSNTEVTTTSKPGIVACPITFDWAEVKNGAPGAAPPANCEVFRTEGQRSSTGLWIFDITELGQRWVDGSLPQFGVLLQERVDAPNSFQTAWLDRTSATPPRIELQSSAPETTTTTESTTTTTTETTTTTTAAEVVVDSGSSAGPSDGFTTPDTTPTTLEPTPTTLGEPEVAASTPVAAPTPVASTKLIGNWPWTVLLLLAFALGMALLSGIVLGPAGDPVGVTHREGGVSRALARADAEPAAHVPSLEAP